MTITTLTTTLFTIVKLPYAYDALEPYISAETMHFHHDKHYAGYVAKLEELIAGTPYDTMTLDEIIRNSDGATFNNAAQVWNHEFFFAQLSPRPQLHPEGMLRAAIIDNFGSVEELKRQMESAAISLFGSGWVWLAADGDGNLHIVAKQNAGTPLTDGLIPIMCIDVWEHAYYIDYRNMRRDSVEALWKILDWSVLEQRYDDAMV
jgi:Fe-Mn family superoxide dismutase